MNPKNENKIHFNDVLKQLQSFVCQQQQQSSEKNENKRHLIILTKKEDINLSNFILFFVNKQIIIFFLNQISIFKRKITTNIFKSWSDNRKKSLLI